jgi:hypothetical protein
VFLETPELLNLKVAIGANQKLNTIIEYKIFKNQDPIKIFNERKGLTFKT